MEIQNSDCKIRVRVWGLKRLNNHLFIKSQKLLKEIEEKKDIFIFTNSTVDGIICGSVILKSIFNNFGNATIRCFTEKIKNIYR